MQLSCIKRLALVESANKLRYRTVEDEHRRPASVYYLAGMADGYVIQETDNIHTTREGCPSLKKFAVTGFLHTMKSWEATGPGIKKGMPPYIAQIDPHSSVEYEVYMTMNGIEIDPRSLEVIHRIQYLITFPGSVTLEALGVIEEVFVRHR